MRSMTLSYLLYLLTYLVALTSASEITGFGIGLENDGLKLIPAAQDFTFVRKFSQNGGFLAPDLVSSEENFPRG